MTIATVAIELDAVDKTFGAVSAVQDASLQIYRGELFGLIGHNGAGKSTLFKMMLGLLAPSRGRISVLGEPVMGTRSRAVRRRIGYLPENVVLYDNLSGLETLQFFARLKGVAEDDCAGLLEKVGLDAAQQRRVGTYSKGMRQRLGFAQALLGQPALLFLDEPTTGLDPRAIRDFYDVLAEMRANGATIVLTSHILAEIQERVDRLALLQSGRITAVGTVDDLRRTVPLPLTFVLLPEPGLAEDLHAALQWQAVAALRWQGGHLCFDAPRAQKMRLLRLLNDMDAFIADVQVLEPSLEDVFLGYPAQEEA